MSKKVEADVTCKRCGASNPADYTFCFCCRVTPEEANGGAASPAKSARKKSAAKKKSSAKKRTAKK